VCVCVCVCVCVFVLLNSRREEKLFRKVRCSWFIYGRNGS